MPILVWQFSNIVCLVCLQTCFFILMEVTHTELAILVRLRIVCQTLLEVVVAGRPSIAHFVNHLLVEVKENLNLFRLVPVLHKKLVVCHALAHFLHSVHVLVFVLAISSIHLDYAVH